MKSSDKKDDRPVAYPKSTETDAQLKNQDEFTERQSNSRSENMPARGGNEQTQEPKKKRPERRDIL
jgi:hypothetical protein